MTEPAGATAPAAGADTRGGFWPLRDLPVVAWLLATAVVAIAHPFVPAPRWLLIHLLMLGAVSHAILVWSRHFAAALLHTRPDDRRAQSQRLVLLNGGALAVVAGVAAHVGPSTAVGATAVAAAVAWHGWSLWRQLRDALRARFAGTVRYYVAAAGFLPVGAALGTALALGLDDPWHTRTMVAHAVVNLLGWVGLTVVGTLVTLWPTMLRTRIADGAERAARRALPVLATSVVAAASAGLLGWRAGVALAILGYVTGLGMTGRTFVEPLGRKPPVSFPAMSVLAGLCWLVGTLLALATGIATSRSWTEVDDRLDWLAPFLVVGFAAQVLLGALCYLVPVAVGGGPTPVRAANAVVDRGGPPRVAATNAGLLVCVLPVPSAVRALASMLVLGCLAAALSLLLLSIRAARSAKASRPGAGGRRRGRRR